MANSELIREILTRIYGQATEAAAWQRLRPLLENFSAGLEAPIPEGPRFSNNDVILISYGDSLTAAQEKPLQTLDRFARTHLATAFSGIHVLPFFPYSSDDGFSVIDFKGVNPDLGQWSDIHQLSRNFDLMVDLVLNHISAQSNWFQRYLNQEPGFECLACEVAPDDNISCVVRPRTTPLLTECVKKDGQVVQVWTTFSPDQIDLNYKSLDVLEKIVEVLLFYIAQGASIIRLDAIAYLWKEPGTCCIHLDQTHDMVKLFRAILDQVAPRTIIITETNVPHAENISYLGNGRDEAQMVYNFTLPPLLLHAFVRQDIKVFAQWLRNLEVPGSEATFFNFTASHDGIGVRPLEGILPDSEIAFLAQHVRNNGGYVSGRMNSDGSESPYELNITYIDALSEKQDDEQTRADRFLASQAIQLVLPGVPAVYIHSLLGTRNWQEGVQKTGRPRTINRRVLDYEEITAQLQDRAGRRHRIFSAYINMLEIRRRQPAFHPLAGFQVPDGAQAGAFVLKRYSAEQIIYAITNITPEKISLALPYNVKTFLTDLITGQKMITNNIRLAPFQFVWLTDEIF